MKSWILLLIGLITITVAGCKDNEENSHLKVSLEIRKFDSSKIDWTRFDAYEPAMGELSNSFEEREELVFYLKLKNEGVATKEVSWAECPFANVKVYNSDDVMVWESYKIFCGGAAFIREFVLYAGEYKEKYFDWNQELTDQPGVFLPPGDYRAVTEVSYYVGPRGSREPISQTLQEQVFSVTAIETR
ncbi:hypothetical protein [Kangiella taiwanensis]|uniref:Intracellular proteinase inhibitor BsuPI domain-containing protein n=1 Tax=Kangiella taiwanensis TaxID=1079179 RepID=A0ABP8HWR9_9GAMM|nr:hypothetical protein [Kangiella taiwanensis]